MLIINSKNKMKIALLFLVMFVEMNATLSNAYLVENTRNIDDDDQEEYSLDDISQQSEHQTSKQQQQKPSLNLLEILATEQTLKYDQNSNKSLKTSNKFNAFNPNTEEFEMRQKLNNLLAYSIASRAEELSLINHPEKERDLKNLIADKSKNEKILGTYGSKACSLTSLAISASKGFNSILDSSTADVKICPWHYEFSYRADRYPHLRLNAKCNCENCLAKTVFDTNDKERYSYCKPVRILMPVLIRKRSSTNDKSNNNSDKFNWEFRMEPVTNSCVCTLNLKPF